MKAIFVVFNINFWLKIVKKGPKIQSKLLWVNNFSGQLNLCWMHVHASRHVSERSIRAQGKIDNWALIWSWVYGWQSSFQMESKLNVSNAREWASIICICKSLHWTPLCCADAMHNNLQHELDSLLWGGGGCCFLAAAAVLLFNSENKNMVSLEWYTTEQKGFAWKTCN